MRILFLSRWFPYPPDNGARIRVYNLLSGLAAQHEVTLLSFTEGPASAEHVAAMRQVCAGVETTPYRPFRPNRLRALAGLLSPLPRSVIDTESAEMHALVAQALRGQRFDVVIASQIDMVPYARQLPVGLKIFEELELTGLYDQFAGERNPLRRMRRALTWWKLSAYVRQLLRDFDAATAVSARERDMIARLAPRSYPLAVVPNGVDVARYSGDLGEPEPDTLIYNGALTYSANFDAVSFFAGEILPRIRAQRPGVRLVVTGRHDGVAVERLPEGVELAGYLPDIRPAVARSWACVVPLRQGGGSRLKILEALAAGTPVISTTKGAEGLNLIPERDILIADTPADFAAATLRVLREPVLREMLRRNGRQAVAAHYDWQPIVQRLLTFIDRLARNAADETAVAPGRVKGDVA